MSNNDRDSFISRRWTIFGVVASTVICSSLFGLLVGRNIRAVGGGAAIGAIGSLIIVAFVLLQIKMKKKNKVISGNPVKVSDDVMQLTAAQILLSSSTDEMPDIAADVRKREEAIAAAAKKEPIRVSFEEAMQVSDELVASLGEPPWLSYIMVEPDEATGFRVEIGVEPLALALVLEANHFPESVRNVPLRVKGVERGRALAAGSPEALVFEENVRRWLREHCLEKA